MCSFVLQVVSGHPLARVVVPFFREGANFTFLRVRHWKKLIFSKNNNVSPLQVATTNIKKEQDGPSSALDAY